MQRNFVGCPILMDGVRTNSEPPAYVQGGWSRGSLPCDVKGLPEPQKGTTIIVRPAVKRALEGTRPDVVAVDEASMLRPIGMSL